MLTEDYIQIDVSLITRDFITSYSMFKFYSTEMNFLEFMPICLLYSRKQLVSYYFK
jgi:hypothetical protein